MYTKRFSIFWQVLLKLKSQSQNQNANNVDKTEKKKKKKTSQLPRWYFRFSKIIQFVNLSTDRE